ncbi:SMI1/KNR4 family protein [Kribbella sp. HUAS MG21]|uniref:SMI1/KNR4 family protein n=1 Tax=Kribbella sp. HUAS MG21 TaxID=3160966 RepID=A0AAU7TAX0_9ACTN
MWLEKVTRLPGAETGAPAEAAAIGACEQALGHPLPEQLKDFLLAADGVTGEWGEGVLWPAAQIAESNREFRTTPDFRELYMPFDPLIFFADSGDGSQYALLRGIDRLDVFRWDHETDSRLWVASSLPDYLDRLAAGSLEG